MMRDFFKPWRRKTGCVALAASLLLMVGWLRTTIGLEDCFSLRISNHNVYQLASCRDGIRCQQVTYHGSGLTLSGIRDLFDFDTLKFDKTESDFENGDEIWDRRWMGIRIARRLMLSTIDFTFCVVPHIYAALLLSIIAGWLLIGKCSQRPRPEAVS